MPEPTDRKRRPATIGAVDAAFPLGMVTRGLPGRKFRLTGLRKFSEFPSLRSSGPQRGDEWPWIGPCTVRPAR
jgi:hypothetical protein